MNQESSKKVVALTQALNATQKVWHKRQSSNAPYTVELTVWTQDEIDFLKAEIIKAVKE